MITSMISSIIRPMINAMITGGGVTPTPPASTGNIIEFINPNDAAGTWDFGDGNSSTTINPTHEYSVHGTYNAVFTSVSGNDDTTRTVIIAEHTLPVVSFTATPRDPDTNIYDFVASGGDSYVFNIDGTEYPSSTAVHTFLSAAQYDASVIATDSYGNTDYDYKSLSVLMPNGLPVGGFTFLRSQLVVTFTSSITDPDGDDTEITYAWAFNDGTGATSTDRNPVHTFPDSPSGNTFNVVLVATDERGGTVTIDHDVTVYTTEQLGANLVVNGDFATDDSSSFIEANASVDLTGGVMTVTGVSGSSGRMETSIATQDIGKQYKLTLDYYVPTAIDQAIKNLIGYEGVGSFPLDSLTATTEEQYLIAEDATGLLRFYAGTIGAQIIITRIALQEVL